MECKNCQKEMEPIRHQDPYFLFWCPFCGTIADCYDLYNKTQYGKEICWNSPNLISKEDRCNV